MKNFISTLILIIIYLALKQDNTMTVFDEKDDYDIYMTYMIEMEYLDTSNFNEYFRNMSVLAITPYINPVYENKLRITYFDDDIDGLRKYYIKKLKEKGYYIEANKYLIMPIRIKEVMIYSSMNEIIEKINKNSDNYIVTKSDSYVKITN